MPEGWDAAAFDRWLTTPPEDRKSNDPAKSLDASVLHLRSAGECTRCGGQGCRSCEGDRGDDAYDEELELDRMEHVYEHGERTL